jgi:hypothetical protein
MDFKNQLLMLLMIKAYDVSFYTLLFLIAGFYTKDYIHLIPITFFGLKTEPKCESKKKNTNELNHLNELNELSELSKLSQVSDLIKSSSISIEIFLHKQNDILAHSLLDYVTNKPNIQSISYSKNKFMLNHKNPIPLNS